MRHIKTISFLVITSCILTACAETTSQSSGSGLFGSSAQNSDIRHPKLKGSIIGQRLGPNLDDVSKRAGLQAEYQALERGKPGESIPWTGSNGVSGFVTPQQTYQVGSQTCRRYEQTISLNGQLQKASGTACREADGAWSALT